MPVWLASQARQEPNSPRAAEPLSTPTANPKPINFTVNYRSRIILRSYNSRNAKRDRKVQRTKGWATRQETMRNRAANLKLLLVSSLLGLGTIFLVSCLHYFLFSPMRDRITDVLSIPGGLIAWPLYPAGVHTDHGSPPWGLLAYVGNVVFYITAWFILLERWQRRRGWLTLPARNEPRSAAARFQRRRLGSRRTPPASPRATASHPIQNRLGAKLAERHAYCASVTLPFTNVTFRSLYT